MMRPILLNTILSSRMFRFILLKLFDLGSLQTLTEHTLKWRLLPGGHQQSSQLHPFDTAVRCCCCTTVLPRPLRLYSNQLNCEQSLTISRLPLWRLNMDDLFKYTCSWSLGDEFRVTGWASTKRWFNLQTRLHPESANIYMVKTRKQTVTRPLALERPIRKSLLTFFSTWFLLVKSCWFLSYRNDIEGVGKQQWSCSGPPGFVLGCISTVHTLFKLRLQV